MSSEMRQFDRVKEKIEIRLDTAEIAWLILGCMLIAGSVFASGYYIGMNAKGTTERETMAVTLEALDDKLLVDEVDEPTDPKYTYDEQLTNPTPAEKVDDPWLAVISKAKDKLESGQIPVDGELSDSDVDGPEIALAGPRPASVVAPVKGAQAPAPAKASWPNPNGANEPAPGTKSQSPPTSAGPQASGYTIQIKAFPKENGANAFAAALQAAGYKPYILTANIPGKGLYYRVRLGKFNTLKEATKMQKSFEKAEGYNTIVTPL